MNYFLAIGPWQIIVILVVVLFGIIPTIIALIDIVRSEFAENNRTVWLLLVLLGNFFGTLLYFIFGRKQKVQKINNASLN